MGVRVVTVVLENRVLLIHYVTIFQYETGRLGHSLPLSDQAVS